MTFTLENLGYPFVHGKRTHLVREWVVVLHYSCVTLAHLAGRVGDFEKIPHTDVCNRLTKRAFANRSIPERAAFAERAVCRSEVNQIGNAAPEDLAVLRASGGRAFDDALQLRTNHAQCYLLKERRAPHRAVLPCCGVFGRERGSVIGPLALHVMFRKVQLPAFYGALELLSPLSRQRVRLGSPKRLPPTSALLVGKRARHRTRSLATVEPASGALSLSDAFARRN